MTDDQEGLARTGDSAAAGGLSGTQPAWVPYAADAWACNTRRVYRSQWAAFVSWCAVGGLDPLPATASTVANYIAQRANAGRSTSTIAASLAAISEAHRSAGFRSPREAPEVRLAWKGIRRRIGVAVQQRSPLLTEDLRRIVQALPDSTIGVRNHALLLIGFAGAFRRGELVALDISDVAFDARGAEITVRRSKTDQEGRGMRKVIAYGLHPDTCPVRSLRRWMDRLGVSRGPLFRPVTRHGVVGAKPLDARAVALVIKAEIARQGIDPATFGGHSLRSGFVTQALAMGAADRDVMAQTAHRSVQMLRHYDRRRSEWLNPASARLGL